MWSLLPRRQPEPRVQHRCGAIPAEGAPDGKGGTAKRRTGRPACGAAGVLVSGRCLAGLPVAAASSGQVGWCGPDYEQSAVPAVSVIPGVNKSPPHPPPYSPLPTPSCVARRAATAPSRGVAMALARRAVPTPLPPPPHAQRLSRGGGSSPYDEFWSV